MKGTSRVPCLRKRTGDGIQEKVRVALLKETEGRESRDKGHRERHVPPAEDWKHKVGHWRRLVSAL